MRKQLYQVQGADRLKLWLEYSRLQDEDPERQVNQCDALARPPAQVMLLTLLARTRTG